ncbi:ATP synthase mitochondrial F1 complex assembly factor 2 [Galdieria sulphuraria]|nr:ATP synthase mitochondrial F1 complex assembly factor 2 [Galdieria sulphuraria]EME32742.1 ATP synthase mitochondrial F1 complex assembly factor 2 [Galdieria sulphuraria]GJD09213.1 ATP synthase mitochondrial F1 complex assembly factor 2 [Galdieria sulphuraria]|eukprot:XP_005709262.1 ATP synthase mitochondrial F1 complex assembly factor 2 [Galdieria sulphuraria]
MICGLRVIGHIGSIVKRELSAGSLQLVRSFKAPFLLQRNRTVCTQQVGHPVQSHATCNLSLRPDNNGLGPKRFYEQVYTVERIPGVYCVSLDGKLLRTRTGKFLESRCRELSLVVASEWEAQHSRILPSSMPVTSLLTTSIDLTKEHRQQFLKTLSEFFNTDTICIRASYPEGLVFRQKVLWDPLIVFLSENWNIQIRTSEDLFGVSQERESLEKIRQYLENQSSLFITALHSATSTTKSLIIGLALSEKAISTRQAMEACRCEEDFQIQYWGDVEGCHDIDRADTFVRLASASLVFSLLRTFPECFHSQN